MVINLIKGQRVEIGTELTNAVVKIKVPGSKD